LFTDVYKINNIQEYLIYCCHLKSKHMFNVRAGGRTGRTPPAGGGEAHVAQGPHVTYGKK